MANLTERPIPSAVLTAVASGERARRGSTGGVGCVQASRLALALALTSLLVAGDARAQEPVPGDGKTTGVTSGGATTPPSGAGEPQAATPDETAPASAPPVVQTRFKGVTVILGGSVRTTITTTGARMLPDATPFYVLPETPGVREGSTKLDARLSTFVIHVQGLEWNGFRFGGLIMAQFFDGNLLSGQYGLTPGNLYVDLANDDWRFAFGLQMDVFSPRIPTMVDSMSAFAASGNPGNATRTEFRVERFVEAGERNRLTLAAAAADALPTNISPDFSNFTENVGFPNGEFDLRWKHGAEDPKALVGWSPLELGASAVVGKFRTFSPAGGFPAFETQLGGVSVDGAARIGRRFGVQGEFYWGQALGPYLAGINQTVNAATQEAVDSRGGWAEVAWYWTAKAHSHAGYGRDVAEDADLAPGMFRSNETAFANLFYDVSRMTRFGLEGTWRRTDYVGLGAYSGPAVMFMTEFRF